MGFSKWEEYRVLLTLASSQLASAQSFCQSGMLGWHVLVFFRFITQNPTCLGYSYHREGAVGYWCREAWMMEAEERMK